jgi:hypothetical protein
MLVLLDVRLLTGAPGFEVEVRNFGAEAILDVEVDSARFARVPKAKFNVINRLGSTLKVVDADRKPDSLLVEFVDDKGDSVITGTRGSLGDLVIDNADPSDLAVTIRFMDAQGHHWLRSLDSLKLA